MHLLRLAVRMWIVIVVKVYCNSQRYTLLLSSDSGTGSLLVTNGKIAILDLESIEGWTFAKYHDCSQFPQVVNFSSVKKLMQIVKIYKVRYTTQPQPTAVVPPFLDLP